MAISSLITNFLFLSVLVGISLSKDLTELEKFYIKYFPSFENLGFKLDKDDQGMLLKTTRKFTRLEAFVHLDNSWLIASSMIY